MRPRLQIASSHHAFSWLRFTTNRGFITPGAFDGENISGVKRVPELPELTVIADKLTHRLRGQKIQQVIVHNHLVIHGTTAEEFETGPVGMSFASVRVDGKFLIADLGEKEIVINPMLTGRFRVYRRSRRPRVSDMFEIRTVSDSLWYSDLKKMGRAYLVDKGDYSKVAEFSGRGPSALDPDLTLEVFRERLRRHNGQIKNVLRNQRFVKGIGNAYADEILLYAGILPLRKRSSLTEEEIERLYVSTRKVLERITAILSERDLLEISKENRDFLMVHNRGGGICPLCGGRISEITANRFKTSFCQTCQK
jgi:formamidopyrimidine-DNA glycosylase